MATIDQLQRELSELRAALRRGEFFTKHAFHHKEGGKDPVGGGGSITVAEEDGSPSVTSVSQINFSNGSVTDNGDGTVDVSITGSGASAGETYVVMSATTGLSAERVLTEGAGILITDGGAGSVVTISNRLRETRIPLGHTLVQF